MKLHHRFYCVDIDKSVMMIMTCAPYSWFEKWVNLEREKRNDDEEYESVKNAIGQKLIDQVLHLYPNIKVILLMYKVLPNSTRN